MPNTSDLEVTVTEEINEEVAGATAPIEAEITDVGESEAAALESISQMFQGLMPYVQASATAVAEGEEFAAGVQTSIFNTASLQLNQMAQARAREAQALAQQMGGPVDMTEFGKALAPTMATMPETFAGAQLHALAQGQVAVQESQAWAGKVFPLYQAEQTKQLTRYFEDKKSDLRDQIAALNAEKPGLINTRLNERLQQEREWELSQANLALEKLKTSHDWYATKEQLKQQRKEYELTRKQLGLDVAGVTGTYGGKPTLAAEGQAAEIANQRREGQLADKEALVKEKQTAMSLAENITQSGEPKTITVSTKVDCDPPLAGTKGVYWEWRKNAKGKKYKQYYMMEDIKQTTAAQARTNDPDEIYNYLLAAGISKGTALQTVRAQMGNQKWSPGQKASTTTKAPKLTKAVLAEKSVSQLQSIAKRMGLKNAGKEKNRSTLTNYILGNKPKANANAGAGGEAKKTKEKKTKKKKNNWWD